MNPRGIALALAAALSLASPVTGRAQGILQLEPLSGDLTVDYDGYRSEATDIPLATTRSLRESISVRLRGAVSDPGLVGFDLSLRPSFAQQGWSSGSLSDTGNRNTLYGSAGLRLLATGPVSLSFNGRRSRDSFRGLFDQATESEVDGFNVSGKFRGQLLSASVTYNETHSDVVFRSASAPLTRRVQDRSRLFLTASNRKTRVRFERLEVNDLGRPTDFLRYQTFATNQQRWGKGSTLMSRFAYTLQEGAGGVETVTWGQNSHLQHTRLISSDLRYTLTDTETSSGRIQGWTAGINEMVRLSPKLAFMLAGSGSQQTADVGRVTNWRIMPRFSANTRLPAGMRLAFGAGVGYRWRDRDTGEGGTRAVVGEQHSVPPSGRFLLDELEPVVSTIRVTNEDGSIAYDVGFDYRLAPAGLLLEVIVLPGGRIQVADVLLVDYEHAVLASSESELLNWAYNVSLQVLGLQAYHSLAADELQKTTDPSLLDSGDSRNVVAGIRYQAGTPLGALNFMAEYRETTNYGQTTEGYVADVSLGFLLGPRLRGGVGAGWSTRTNGLQYDLFRANARLTWAAVAQLQMYGDLSASYWERIDQSERFIGGALGVDWIAGLLTVGARLEHSSLDGTFIRRGELIDPIRLRTRFSVRASRRF